MITLSHLERFESVSPRTAPKLPALSQAADDRHPDDDLAREPPNHKNEDCKDKAMPESPPSYPHIWSCVLYLLFAKYKQYFVKYNERKWKSQVPEMNENEVILIALRKFEAF